MGIFFHATMPGMEKSAIVMPFAHKDFTFFQKENTSEEFDILCFLALFTIILWFFFNSNRLIPSAVDLKLIFFDESCEEGTTSV